MEPGPLDVGRLRVEPDLSNAAPFLAAAVVTGGQVTVPGWPERTTQAGDALRAPAAQVRRTGRAATTRAWRSPAPSASTGVDLDLGDVGELAPVLAAVAALAERPSRLRGIAHLRHHETDRLAAIAHRGQRRSAATSGRPTTGCEIVPRPLHGGVLSTYDDHRLATMAAVLGLCVAGIEVDDVATTAKTLPGFVDLWTAMLAGAVCDPTTRPRARRGRRPRPAVAVAPAHEGPAQRTTTRVTGVVVDRRPRSHHGAGRATATWWR